MAGWDTIKSFVNTEFKQSVEEGRDKDAVEALRPEYEAAGDDVEKLRAVWQKILTLPIREDFPFQEPSDLETIKSLRAEGPRRLDLKLNDDELFDRMYGAWLGRSAGCALGKPVEHWMGFDKGMTSRERIKMHLEGAGENEYPLNYYFSKNSTAKDVLGGLICPLSTREEISFMESDDDIRYTVIGQIVMNQYGKNFTTHNVASTWINQLPYAMVCTAETQAYRNLVMRYEFHMSGSRCPAIDWNWVATNDNPYREWIGAQIRADSWGYATPGNPDLAADFAWRDARLSHVKNGIYGEMFCAALIAAAFALDDPRAVVEAALAEIPKTSRLYSEMRQVVEICEKHGNSWDNFELVLDDIYALLGHYDPVHTNNNAGLVVAALLIGGHDYEKAITFSVMGGWDSDCNGATVGSIWGAMHGAKALPGKWIDPLHDTLNSQIIDYHPIAISECARRSVKIARDVAAAE